MSLQSQIEHWLADRVQRRELEREQSAGGGAGDGGWERGGRVGLGLAVEELFRDCRHGRSFFLTRPFHRTPLSSLLTKNLKSLPRFKLNLAILLSILLIC